MGVIPHFPYVYSGLILTIVTINYSCLSLKNSRVGECHISGTQMAPLAIQITYLYLSTVVPAPGIFTFTLCYHLVLKSVLPPELLYPGRRWYFP